MNYYLKLALTYAVVTGISIVAGWVLARLARSRPRKTPEYTLFIPPHPKPKTELCDFKALCENGKQTV